MSRRAREVLFLGTAIAVAQCIRNEGPTSIRAMGERPQNKGGAATGEQGRRCDRRFRLRRNHLLAPLAVRGEIVVLLERQPPRERLTCTEVSLTFKWPVVEALRQVTGIDQLSWYFEIHVAFPKTTHLGGLMGDGRGNVTWIPGSELRRLATGKLPFMPAERAFTYPGSRRPR